MYLILWIICCVHTAWSLRPPLDKPNIVVLFADDFGYGDLSSYGHPSQEFGPIDQMAREGIRFTNWYSASSLCTPSRAAILTASESVALQAIPFNPEGRSPIRSGVYARDIPDRVFEPYSSGGLPREEITLAEALKELGYTTGMVGKWHLGINAHNFRDGYHLPTHHGFDYVGATLPFTNHWDCDTEKVHLDSPLQSYCYLYYNKTMVQQPINHHNLTETFVYDAKAFIYNSVEQPFFLYLSFAHTHTNLFAGPKFRGSSRRGRYGDDVNEMAWAVGEVLEVLNSTGLSGNTLVIFTSDNGPHLEKCQESGSSGILKGGKGTTWEGGLRMPAVAWWPGVIDSGQVNHELVAQWMSLTAVDIAGGTLPSDRIIDGKSIKSVLLKGERSPHEIMFFHCNDRLMAVRYGAYKLHFHVHALPSEELLQTASCFSGGFPTRNWYHCIDCYGSCITSHDPPLIYDVDADPGESYPLPAGQHEGMLAKVTALIKDFEENLTLPYPQINDSMDLRLNPCCNPPYCSCPSK
ncbi:LOW QUALITY PROTEIN: arylsulfatase-like [Ptychodera flava]|uniref:LOW QUALITY PROTEIN: arylsulfatase-like n=1 Tax=Ptychodera flava TaxID=63121 RepID=UPI00396A776F